MDAYSYKSMEEILIEEVQKRPAIYDKSTAAYRNSRVREEGWKQVAKAVNMTDVEAVKKRWRTLRDSFIKIYKSLKFNPKQRVRWLYYRQLLFLIPHTEHGDSKQLPVDDTLRTESDETQDTAYGGDGEADSGSDHQFVPEDAVVDAARPKRRRSKRVLEEDRLPLARNLSDADSFPDADEQFLLSCLPALKRMRPKDNAMARMRIQQVLLDVEFGEEELEGVLLIPKVEVGDV